MPDAGNIEARVTIKYDGSGLAQAKEDLQSLAEIASGELTDGTNSANDALSGLDQQMLSSGESTRALTSSVSGMEKPFTAAEGYITSVTEAMGEHQSALEDTGSAYEALQKPIESTTALLEDASPSLFAISEHAQSLQEQLGNVSDGFTAIGQSLSDPIQSLPTLTANMQSLSEQFDPLTYGVNASTENMGAFQDTLSNPDPFHAIQQNLSDTGQTWSDFSSTVGSDNTAFMQGMTATAEESGKAFSSMSANVQATGKTFAESTGDVQDFTDQVSTMGETVASVNKGMGASVSGTSEAWGSGSAGGLFGGLMEGLNQVAMPLMAVQMIGMAVGAVSTGIYNMAALAEGPAAHTMGTFTGAIDLMGQHAQATAEQFSEGFGKGILPTLDAMNSVASQNNDSNFFSGIGGFLGGTVGVLGDAAQILGGGLVGGIAKILTLNPENTIGNDWMLAGAEGLQNTWANLTGAPEPFPGPAYTQQPNINMPQIQQQLAQNTAVMTAQANDPQYLAAQAYLTSQTADATMGQKIYDVGHMTGMSAFDYTPQSYQNSMMSAIAAGQPVAGISAVDTNRAYFDSIATPDLIGQGCFPAGTRVLMADSSTRSIEALQVGESVLAHNGTQHVATTVLALIKPPPRRVYALTFDDGSTLTLTNSHPVSTEQGWKSLSPEETHKENPDLVVTALQVGDRVQTVDGLCTLEGIQEREVVQIYNITVDNPHTFYANGVLVHNKVMSSIMQQVADTTIPPTDLHNSNLIQSLASNFSSADLSHTFTATVNWASSGLEQGFTAVASWASQGLSQAFTAVASWASQGISQAFTAVASWASQGLSQAYTAVASWAANGLEHSFEGAASWIAQGGLEHTFEGIASWFASGGLQHTFEGVANWVASGGLQHTFEGVTDWIGENLEHTFTGVASWIGQNLNVNLLAGGMTPGFANGVQNFGGGWAVTGEQGPELVYLPQGASVYPHSAGFSPLNIGSNNNSGGNTGSGPITIHIELDSQVLAHQTMPYLASEIRMMTGRRQ